MLKFSRDVTRVFALAFAMLILQSSLSIAQVSVSLPNTTAKSGTSVVLPVSVGNLTGQGVYSYQFKITYNPHVVNITAVDAAGTISSAMQVSSTTDSSGGSITVAAAGASTLTGSGTLLNLDAKIIGSGTTVLTWQNLEFNEGSPTATSKNGSVGTATVSVSIPVLTDSLGSTVLIPVNADSSVTGLSVYSYQFSVSYDTTIIQITGQGYSTTGTILPSSALVTSNVSVPGTVSIAAAGTSVLSGSGPLIYLTGEVIGVGTTALALSGFEYNEGTPSAAMTNGSLTGTKVHHKPLITGYTPQSLSRVQRNSPVTFAVTASSPDQGDTLTYTWIVNRITKQTGYNSFFVQTFTDSGYVDSVKVVVTDVAGLTASYTWGFLVTAVQELPGLPADYALGQNYPNPFNPTTSIKFDLPNMSSVRIVVYDILGREVRSLINDNMAAGRYSVTWDGLNDYGQQVTSGVYFYRMEAGTFTTMKKMLLLK